MPRQPRLEPLSLQDRRILFRNFSGEAGRFNAPGDRNFNLVLNPEEARALADLGWNVKYLKARDPEEEPLARIEVSVKYDKYPPRIVIITSRGKTALTEDLIGLLDWAEFDNLDMLIRPSYWEVNGRSGYKAYLKALYATIHEDELELKYADVPDYPLPDSAQRTIQASSEILAIERGEEKPPF